MPSINVPINDAQNTNQDRNDKIQTQSRTLPLPKINEVCTIPNQILNTNSQEEQNGTKDSSELKIERKVSIEKSPRSPRSPRGDHKYPITTISPRFRIPKEVQLHREGSAWIKSGKKWKLISMATQDDGSIVYEKNNKKKRIINLLTASGVRYIAGKEPHVYQIAIQTKGWICKLSFGNDNMAVEDWFNTIEAIRMRAQAENVTQPTTAIDRTPTKSKHENSKLLAFRHDFNLDDGEHIMMELKCHIETPNLKDNGYLYITENYLCYASKKNTLRFGFSEIISIRSVIDNQFQLKTRDDKLCDFSTLKHKGISKETKREPVILVLYLWYHAPTYFTTDHIQIAINTYNERKRQEELEERKRQEELEERKRKGLEEKKGKEKDYVSTYSDEVKKIKENEVRNQQLLKITRDSLARSKNVKLYRIDSTGSHRMGQDIQMSTSKENHSSLHESLEERNPKENPENLGLDLVMLYTQWNMQLEVLVVLHHGYFPVVLNLCENHFQLENKSLMLDQLHRPLCTKKENWLDVSYFYGAIFSITIEECWQMFVSFNGGERHLRIFSSCLQLILNQFFLRCTKNRFDVIWTTKEFPYEDPTITKLFLLEKTNLVEK